MTSAAPTCPEGEAKLDLDGLLDRLCFNMRQANVAMCRHLAPALAALDLTQKQCAVLQLIGANPGVSQVDLASTLGTDRATMMAMVDRLEQRGLLQRRKSTADRRRQELTLTADGADIQLQARAAINAHEKQFRSLFTPAELRAFIKALGRIHGQG